MIRSLTLMILIASALQSSPIFASCRMPKKQGGFNGYMISEVAKCFEGSMCNVHAYGVLQKIRFSGDLVLAESLVNGQCVVSAYQVDAVPDNCRAQITEVDTAEKCE